MRSEADVKGLHAVFVATGDDSSAINTAVRDTLQWVLDNIPTEEMIDEYLATGQEYQCFTCPVGIRIDAMAIDPKTA